MTRLFESDSDVRNVALGTWPGFLAFGFGSGLSRHAPGTMGTLVAIPFAVLLKMLPAAVFWLLLVATFLVGVWLCRVTSDRLNQHDPGGIVWDEMVGYWLTVAFIPLHWAWFVAAFAAFRLFDIIKPWPIRQIEKRLGGGLGIMVDDIIAAGMAIVVLHAAAYGLTLI